ncbi:MAG: hypothetical protein K0S82_429 [Gaiellaceae bacterium]|nr:hypothetical protein [Gaiellaceae bacterium]
MSSYDARRVVFPDRLPADPEHEAANAARIRKGEVAGLLREREGIAARREAILAQTATERLVVVDAEGNPVDPPLYVKREAVTVRRRQLAGEVRVVDEALEAVDREIERHRDAAS